jgi:hypothetical protein
MLILSIALLLSLIGNAILGWALVKHVDLIADAHDIETKAVADLNALKAKL